MTHHDTDAWVEQVRAVGKRLDDLRQRAPRSEERCDHPRKRPCGYCHENFCPNDGCDPNHIENCREAMRP